MQHNTKSVWSALSKFYHWIIAICFLISAVIAGYLFTLDRFTSEADEHAFVSVIFWHKSFGTLVFFLAFFSIYWRIKNKPPELPEGLSAWQHKSTDIMHWLLFGMMIIVPVTGLIGTEIGNYKFLFFYLFEVPHFYPANKELADIPYAMHIYIGWVAAVLLVVHIGASLLHHFIYKDNILRRMLPSMLVKQGVEEEE